MLRVLLLALLGLAFGDDNYTTCPPRPPAASGAAVAADPGVQAALLSVQALLKAKAGTLPTGLVATVVYDQQVLWSGGFGLRDKFSASKAAPAPSDLVRIASITKVFTDLLLFKLRDAGTVILDAPLSKYVPVKLGKLGRTKGTVTLRNLASHTSGLPREIPFPCSFGGNACAESEVLEVLDGLLPVLPPNRRFHYSNLGIALLGRALGHAAGDNAYESLLGAEVLAPLLMANATFSTAEVLAKNLLATGASSTGSQLNFSEICVPAKGAIGSWGAPCGCLWASADDMAKLMMLFLREDAPADDAKQLVDGDTIAEILMPSILLGDGSSAVGSPWEMKYSSGHWIKSKQGELPGYRSSVSIVEELKLGIFTSALISDTDELSVWTIPSLDLLIPAVSAADWANKPPPAALPAASKLKQMIGGYYKPGTVTIALDASNKFLIFSEGASQPSMNLTAIDGIAMTQAMRAQPITTKQGCRWLDDGSDLEILSWQWNAAGDKVVSIMFMHGKFGKIE